MLLGFLTPIPCFLTQGKEALRLETVPSDTLPCLKVDDFHLSLGSCPLEGQELNSCGCIIPLHQDS